MTEYLMPGDRVSAAETLGQSKKVILGPGLRRKDDEQVVACKAGFLHFKEPNTFWLDTYQRRYVPVRGDAVIGLVTARVGDLFRVDIGGSESAMLSYLSFEAATKKNRPDVSPGDIVFAQLSVANKIGEPELTCINSRGKKGKLGVLNDGMVFNCSLSLARTLLNNSCPLLNHLTKHLAYEIAVGMNGRIWIKTKNVQTTIGLANAILAAEFITYDEMLALCDNIGNLILHNS